MEMRASAGGNLVVAGLQLLAYTVFLSPVIVFWIDLKDGKSVPCALAPAGRFGVGLLLAAFLLWPIHLLLRWSGLSEIGTP